MPRQPVITQGKIGPLEIAAVKASVDPFLGLDKFEVPKIVAEFMRKNCALYDKRSFKKCVEVFVREKSNLGMSDDLPHPLDCKNDPIEQFSINISAFLRNARTFAKFVGQSGELATPIVAYYSAKLAVSFFTEFFLKWESPSPTHGISLVPLQNKDISLDPVEHCFEIRIKSAGAFQRLAACRS